MIIIINIIFLALVSLKLLSYTLQMGTKRNVWIASISAALLVALGIWQLLTPPSKGKHPSGSPSPMPALCVLSGDMKDARRDRPPDGGFENLGGMVRLNFSAETVDDCKVAVATYCSRRLSQGYKPGNLIMIFRPSPEAQTERHYLTAHCVVERVREKKE